PGAAAVPSSALPEGGDPLPGAARTPISEEEAILRALGFSPALESASLGAQSAQQQLSAEDGRYPYSLLADAGLSRNASTQLRADTSVAAARTEAVDLSVGVRRVFPFGATAEVRASEQYFDR